MRASKSHAALTPDLRRLSSCFGVPAAIALLATVLLILEIPIGEDRLLIALAAAWPATLAASLYAQGSGMRPVSGLLPQIAAGAAAAVLAWFWREASVSLEYFYPGLAAACLAAPAARLKDPDSYWVWAGRFCIAAAFACAAALIGWGASKATLYSAEHLFGFPGNDLALRLAKDLAALFFIAGASLVFLALLPPIADETLTADEKAFLRRAIAALASWALAPFVLAYSALLWLYAAKIALAGSLPDGQIGWMVAAFGASALATILLSAPQRRDGPAQTRLLWRIWPYLVIAPLALLGFALYARVAAHGLTPARYMLALLGGLCAVCALAASISRESLPRFAPAAGAIALTLASFGPWGAAATSERWQRATIREIYAAQGRLAEGRLVVEGEPPTMTPQEADRCRAAIDYLWSVGALDLLLAEKDQELGNDVTNFCPEQEPRPGAKYRAFFNDAQWLSTDDASRFSIVGSFRLNKTSEIHVADLTLTVKDGRIKVSRGNAPPAVFDLVEIMRDQNRRGHSLRHTHLLKPTSGDARYIFLVQNLAVTISPDGPAELDDLEAFLLRRE
jgi:hypothetical protein